jgi:hypothetical protein
MEGELTSSRNRHGLRYRMSRLVIEGGGLSDAQGHYCRRYDQSVSDFWGPSQQRAGPFAEFAETRS